MSYGPSIGHWATAMFIIIEILGIAYVTIMCVQLTRCHTQEDVDAQTCREELRDSLALTGEIMIFMIFLYGLILYLIHLFLDTPYGNMGIVSTATSMWLFTAEICAAVMSLFL